MRSVSLACRTKGLRKVALIARAIAAVPLPQNFRLDGEPDEDGWGGGGGGDEKFFTFGLVGDLFDCDMKMCFWFAELFEVCLEVGKLLWRLMMMVVVVVVVWWGGNVGGGWYGPGKARS